MNNKSGAGTYKYHHRTRAEYLHWLFPPPHHQSVLVFTPNYVSDIQLLINCEKNQLR